MNNVSDYGEDEWPESLDEPVPPRSPRSNIPCYNGALSASESGSLKRFAVRKRSDMVLYNMAVILAAVATGFDIRISNTSAIHPRLHNVDEDANIKPDKETFIGQRRDAYLAAVRDSFIEPENYEHYQTTTSPGYPHHTYHGYQTRYRPPVNFDMPITFQQESAGNTSAVDSSGSSKDDEMSGKDRALDASPARRPSSDVDEQSWPMFTPPSDVYQRQTSDTGSSCSAAFETPRGTPKTTPQRQYVKFLEHDGRAQAVAPPTHRRTPSNTSTSSAGGVNSSCSSSHEPTATTASTTSTNTTTTTSGGGKSDYDYSSDYRLPSPHPPLPPRRLPPTSEPPPERPGTLDINPLPGLRPRPPGGILKYSSPGHMPPAKHSSPKVTTPTTSDSGITQDDFSFVSVRSRASPGSTPPHIATYRTLLDIDVEGQSDDSTKPLSEHQKQKQNRKLSFSDREQEIL